MFTDLFSFCPLAQANSFSFFFFCCVQKETTSDLWSRNNSVAFLGDRNSIASARYHNHKGEKTPPSVISARAYVGFVFTFSLLGVHSGHARLVTGRVWRVEIIWCRSARAGHLTHPYHFQSPISVQRVSDVTKNHGFFLRIVNKHHWTRHAQVATTTAHTFVRPKLCLEKRSKKQKHVLARNTKT